MCGLSMNHYTIRKIFIFFISSIFLVSCSDDGTDRDNQIPHDFNYDMNDLDQSLRIVLMMGHVAAGMELYRQGELTMAAPHLLHPISETHKKEREGFQEMGLDVVSFVLVSTALEAKRPASEVEPFLKKAEENLITIASKIDGDPINQIMFLLEQLEDEYKIGLTDGVITDIGEYQDAYGFAVTAKLIAANSSLSNADMLVQSLNDLLSLWPEGPKPTANPSSISLISSQVSEIKRLL